MTMSPFCENVSLILLDERWDVYFLNGIHRSQPKPWHLEPFFLYLVCSFLKKEKKKPQDLTLFFSWCFSWFLIFNEWRKRERNFFWKGTGNTWILSETFFFFKYCLQLDILIASLLLQLPNPSASIGMSHNSSCSIHHS